MSTSCRPVRRPPRLHLALAALVPILVAASARAQIPDEFTNLRVLPKDTGKGELVETMRGFAMALGVRCQHCHVGEDPTDLSTFDFAADDKPPKLTARVMLRMVEAINRDHLAEIGKDPDERLAVRCVTCHHGQPRPQSLESVLAEAVEEGGVEAAVARYRELREEYYGGFTYDFGERTLVALAESLDKEGKLPEAMGILGLNLEFHPDSGLAHFALGEGYRRTGEKTLAIESFRRALELLPGNPVAEQRLRELTSEGEEP